MGVFTDYFAADSDDEAASLIGQGPVAAGGFDTFEAKGLDPVVQMGHVEELLTGVAYDDVVADERSGKVLAVHDGGEQLVMTVTDRLQQALADADDAKLRQVAQGWASAEEFGGAVDASDLAELLTEFSGLASRARDKGRRLYCWICV